jgi:polygalacturonase
LARFKLTVLAADSIVNRFCRSRCDFAQSFGLRGAKAMGLNWNHRRDILKLAAGGLAASPLFALPQRGLTNVTLGRPQDGFYPVTRFGAKGDGRSLDTPAINAAIEAASKAGGGVVLLPAGAYLCYSIRLKSNVTLQLASGTTIVAADGPSPGEQGKYDLAESNAPWEDYQDFGHNHWHNSLIWGEDLENVAIVGGGLIWGKGLSRGWGAGPKAEQPGAGNKAIALKSCRNVLLRDFSILHGGHFGVLATGVDNFTVDNLTIDTNRDGIDIDCCQNVHISNCTVNSPWDDAICLKSSYALGYARATEMVTISNCVVTGSFEEGSLLDGSYKRLSHDAKQPRTGRIKFGTESNGGFKNIVVANCVFEGCRGLAIESVDGAVIEDVCLNNLTMREIAGAPIFIRLGSRMRGPLGIPAGVIRRVSISNFSCTVAPLPHICSIISGIPDHPIEDLRISHATILGAGGGSASDAALEIEEKEKDYPEPTMFGTTPARGFFIRHVRGIEMSEIKLESAREDDRPAFVLKDVQGGDFRFLRLPSATEGNMFVLSKVREFSVFQSKPLADSEWPWVDEKRL